MKILYVTNDMPPKGCGVAQFGQLQSSALKSAGLDVTVWYADYPTYLPKDAFYYDVIHINFHPATLGHIQSQHVPAGPLLSCHFHEVDTNWDETHKAPSLWYSADLIFYAEKVPGTVFHPMPVPEYRSKVQAPTDYTVRIGYTGLRKDGLDWLQPICEKNGWTLDVSSGWLPLHEEIDRLAACKLIVCHPHSGYAGQSSAITTALAAQRPILINNSQMLSTVRELDHLDELYINDDPEAGIEDILYHMACGYYAIPRDLAARLSWTTITTRLIRAWCIELALRKANDLPFDVVDRLRADL